MITFRVIVFYLCRQYIREDSPCNQMDEGFLIHKKDRPKTALLHINRSLSTTFVVVLLNQRHPKTKQQPQIDTTAAIKQ